MCSISDPQTVATFDPVSLSWALASINAAELAAGAYVIRITCTAGSYADQVAYHDFEFLLTDPCAPTVLPTFDDVSYQIDGEAIDIPFAPFAGVAMELCPHSFQYSLTLAESGTIVGDAALDLYATVDSARLVIQVYAESALGTQAQTLQLSLTGTLENGQSYSTPITVTYLAKEQAEVDP